MHKFATLQTGTTLDQAIFKFDDVASQVISATQIDVGDSYTFRVELDLPQVPADQRSDLKVEIFALTADQGLFAYVKHFHLLHMSLSVNVRPTEVGGFHICQTHVPEVTNERGKQLNAVQDHPVYEEHTFTQEGAGNLVNK